MIDIGEIKFGDNGLIPAIVQDKVTGNVLMLAYMNNEALQKTIETKKAYYYSRSRKELWFKGETSGNIQEVEEIRLDCDNDTILLKVKQNGIACHTGSKSCFFKEINDSGINESKRLNGIDNIIGRLFETIMDRKLNPKEGTYTNYLFDKGIDKILKKVGEEASEVLIAAKNNSSEELIYEVSDLFYHILVLLADKNIDIQEILVELEKRKK